MYIPLRFTTTLEIPNILYYAGFGEGTSSILSQSGDGNFVAGIKSKYDGVFKITYGKLEGFGIRNGIAANGGNQGTTIDFYDFSKPN